MIRLTYDALRGEAVPDGKVTQLVSDMILGKPYSGMYSTENVFNGVRLAIVLGLISHDCVEFRFKGEVIAVNEYGAIKDWPVGFCDYNTDTASTILTCAMAKRRRNHAEVAG